MKRLLVGILWCVLVFSGGGAWGQGQLINGHRTLTGGLNACNATGSSNAFTCNLPYPLPAYNERQCFTMKANHTITGAATVNVDSRGTRTIKKYVAGTALDLAPNDIVSDQFVLLCYDGTNMQAVAMGGSASGTNPVYAEGIEFDGTAVRTASQEPGFLRGGTEDLTDGGGEGGKIQTRTDGSLEYTDNAAIAVRHRGFLLPYPLSFNLTSEDCTSDPSGGKITLNLSGQLVCATDVVGEGGVGTGDLTAFGTCATGDCATTGSPLTGMWWLQSTQPSAPASTQGRMWFDSTSDNVSLITSAGVVKRMVQSIDATEHFFLTALSAEGVLSSARPSSAALTDSATLAKIDAAQRFTNKQTVPRPCQLSAASGIPTAPNADACDVVWRHDVSDALTIADPTATSPNPAPFQPLLFSFYAAAEETLTWGSAYAAGSDIQLPTVIPAGKYLRVLVRYDPTSTKWETYSAVPGTVVMSSIDLAGSTSGIISILPQAAAGTYNFNLPTSAGTTGQPLLSGGGGASPMTFGTLSVAGGGSGATTLTGLLIGNGTSPFTAATSSTVGQVLRVTGANTYGFGALDLADTDAITNDLPYANLTAAGAASKLLGRGDSGPGDWQEITLGTGLSMSGTTLNAAGGGTGTIHLSVGGYSLPPSNPAQLDASENNLRLLFDASTSECAIWQGRMNVDYAGSPVLKFPYSMTSATSGGVSIDVSVMAVTSGDAAEINTDSYATVNNCDDGTVPGTAGHINTISCTLTNNDSLAASDYFKIKICRAVADASDTATGDLEAVAPVLEYSR